MKLGPADWMNMSAPPRRIGIIAKHTTGILDKGRRQGICSLVIVQRYVKTLLHPNSKFHNAKAQLVYQRGGHSLTCAFTPQSGHELADSQGAILPETALIYPAQSLLLPS